MPCAPFSMLGSSSGTGCIEVCFPVHSSWDSKDISVVGVSDYVEEYMSFVM